MQGQDAADPAAGYFAGDDAEVGVAFAARPRRDAERADRGQLAGVSDDASRAADQDAPPLGQGLIEVIDLEGHALSVFGGQARPPAGTDHDVVPERRVVDRDRHRTPWLDEDQPPHTGRPEVAAALTGIQR